MAPDHSNFSYTMKHALSIVLGSFVAAAAVAHTHDGEHPHAPAKNNYSFVENLGQWPDAVLFRTHVNGAALFVEEHAWTWSKFEASAVDRMHDIATLSKEERDALQFNGHAWRMHFVDATGSARPKGVDKFAHYQNYFIGNDRALWHGHVGAYGSLEQKDVWPGIDMVMRTLEGNFKYDVVLHPGADNGRIALAYDGLEGMALGERGELILKTSVGEVMEMAPVAFYADDEDERISCRFVLDGNTVRFAFPNGYDEDRTVVIDPVLIAATYSGATGDSNYGHCATYDDAGNIYTGARNFGPTYPATVGAFQTTMGGGGTDISLSKYNPDGSDLIWAAYLGGSNGENPHSLIVNAQGELIVLGSTDSNDFPVTDGSFDETHNGENDIVLVHIAADGSSLIGSTYIGASGSDGYNQMWGNYGEAYRGEVYVDMQGNILVASFTSSADFPVTPGVWQTELAGEQDGVLVKMDPTCSQVLASTFVGGSSSDNAMGIRIAQNGDIFVAGITQSSDMTFPTGALMDAYQGGERDAYVLRLTSDFTTAVAGTYFGTADSDGAYFIDTDTDDNVWIFGQSTGEVPIFPTGTYGSSGEIFLLKLTPQLNETLVSTMIPGNMAPVAFLVDVCNHVYISGYNTGGTLPTTSDALYQDGGFYLAAFDVDMTTILFGSFYGGSHVDGGTSRFDKNGIIYQGVCSGGNSMQSTTWAWRTTNAIAWDIAVFKIDFAVAGVQANIFSTSTTGCVPVTFTLNAVGQATLFTWDFGNGLPLQTGNEVNVSYDTPGAYPVILIGTDPNSCNLADTTYITLNVYDPEELLADFQPTPVSSCDGYFLQVDNSSIGANQYTWNFGDGASSAAFEPVHEYAGPGTYTVALEVRNSICVDTASVDLPVTFVVPQLPFDPPSPVPLCPGGDAVLTAGTGFDSYAWSTGGNSSSISVDEPGYYLITVTDGACEAVDSVQVLQSLPHPPMPDVYKCAGGSVSISPGFAVSSILWSNSQNTPTITVDEDGIYTFTAIDDVGCEATGAITVVEIPVDRGDGFIPNVFTPNNDQKNDQFLIVGEGLQNFSMEIYDRWGLKMFETATQTKGWNGGLDNATGDVVPDGTYYYIIKFRDICSTEPSTTHTGHVTLLR